MIEQRRRERNATGASVGPALTAVIFVNPGVGFAEATACPTMGTGGFSVTDDLQTLQAGPRRLVFFTVGTSF